MLLLLLPRLPATGPLSSRRWLSIVMSWEIDSNGDNEDSGGGRCIKVVVVHRRWWLSHR